MTQPLISNAHSSAIPCSSCLPFANGPTGTVLPQQGTPPIARSDDKSLLSSGLREPSSERLDIWRRRVIGKEDVHNDSLRLETGVYALVLKSLKQQGDQI